MAAVGVMTRALAGAVVASVVTIAPVVLVWATLHGPWPSMLAAAQHPRLLPRVLEEQSDASDLLGLVVAAGWLLWAWMMVCLGSGLLALARGRQPRRLPAGAWLQRAAGVAAGSMLAAVPALRSSVAVAAPPAAVMSVLPHVASPAASAGSAHAGQRARSASTAASARLYVVQPGDTLWSIAARELGSPLRWRQIAALNQGRPQPDGEMLVDDHWIFPGWTLLLPESTAPPGEPAPRVSPAAASGASQGAGPAVDEGLSSAVAHSRGEAPGRVSASGSGPAPQLGTGLGDRSRGTVLDGRAIIPPSRHRNPAPVVEEMLVLGVLAGGVVLLVDRLRRVQQRHRRDGLRIALPPRDVLALEGQLRRRADLAPRAAAGAAVASLHVAAAEAGVPVPLVAAVRIGAHGAELALVASDDPRADVDPTLWCDPLDPTARRLLVPGSGPGWWSPMPAGVRGPSIEESVLLGHGSKSTPRRRSGRLDALVGPPPVELVEPGTLVTLGVEDDRLVLVDLAVLGALALRGPWARGALRAMAVELATAPMAVEVDLVLVGFSDTFDIFDRARRIDDLARACTVAEACLAQRPGQPSAGATATGALHGSGAAVPGPTGDIQGAWSTDAARALSPERSELLDPYVTTVFLCAPTSSPPADTSRAAFDSTGSHFRGAGLGGAEHISAEGLPSAARLDATGHFDATGHIGSGSRSRGGTWLPGEPARPGGEGAGVHDDARRLAELACASDGLVAAVFGWPVPGVPWQACGDGARIVLERCSGGDGAPWWPRPASSTVRGEARSPVQAERGQAIARLRPQQLDAKRAAQISSLLRTASDMNAVEPVDASRDAVEREPETVFGEVVASDDPLHDAVEPSAAGAQGVGSDPGAGARIDGSPIGGVAVVPPAPCDATKVELENALWASGDPRGDCSLSVDPDCSLSVDSDTATLCPTTKDLSGASVAGSEVAPGAVEVRILGPVQVVGAERPFTRAWSLDLVVYLALHPAGATTDQWATALWPDRLMAPASLHSTASAARRALGATADGSDHLPRSHGRLCLAASVTSDWQAFTAGAAEMDPEAWRRSLQLVRGRPFEGVRAIDWAVLEGVLPVIEASVVDVANRLATWALEIGDAATAQWAARQGLLVSPYDERLYRVLLRAADLAGNPAGVESAMAELLRLVAEDVEPYDAVHPDTLALYRALSRRGERAARR